MKSFQICDTQIGAKRPCGPITRAKTNYGLSEDTQLLFREYWRSFWRRRRTKWLEIQSHPSRKTSQNMKCFFLPVKHKKNCLASEGIHYLSNIPRLQINYYHIIKDYCLVQVSKSRQSSWKIIIWKDSLDLEYCTNFEIVLKKVFSVKTFYAKSKKLRNFNK